MRLLLYRWGNQAERGCIMCHGGSKEQSRMGSSPGPKALNYHTMLLSSHRIKLLVKCNGISLGKYPSYPHVTNGEIRPWGIPVSPYERLHSVECLIMWKSEIIASLHFFCLHFVWNFACGWVEMVSLPFRLWLTSLKSEAFGWTVHRLYPMAGTFLNIERVMEINTVSVS